MEYKRTTDLAVVSHSREYRGIYILPKMGKTWIKTDSVVTSVFKPTFRAASLPANCRASGANVPKSDSMTRSKLDMFPYKGRGSKQAKTHNLTTHGLFVWSIRGASLELYEALGGDIVKHIICFQTKAYTRPTTGTQNCLNSFTFLYIKCTNSTVQCLHQAVMLHLTITYGCIIKLSFSFCVHWERIACVWVCVLRNLRKHEEATNPELKSTLLCFGQSFTLMSHIMVWSFLVVFSICLTDVPDGFY